MKTLETFTPTFPDGTQRRDVGPVTITTDNRVRALRSLDDIRAVYGDAHDAQFDYLTARGLDDETRLVRYAGEFYDISECEPAPNEYRRFGWDGVSTQSAFNAILFCYFDADGNALDGVIVGHATW